LDFLDRCFEKYSKIKFGENGRRVVPFGRTDRRTDRPDEANFRFSQFCERAEQADAYYYYYYYYYYYVLFNIPEVFKRKVTC